MVMIHNEGGHGNPEPLSGGGNGIMMPNKLKLNPNKMAALLLGFHLTLEGGSMLMIDVVALSLKTHVVSLGGIPIPTANPGCPGSDGSQLQLGQQLCLFLEKKELAMPWLHST